MCAISATLRTVARSYPMVAKASRAAFRIRLLVSAELTRLLDAAFSIAFRMASPRILCNHMRMQTLVCIRSLAVRTGDYPELLGRGGSDEDSCYRSNRARR